MRAVVALARHLQLVNMIAVSDGEATIRALCQQTGASEKTIRRDIALLREAGYSLHETIGPRGRKTFQLDRADELRRLHFTLEEAAALYLGRQFLEPLAGTYFFRGAQRAFQKIRATLGEAPLRHVDRLAAAFYHKSHGLTDYSQKDELLDDLVRAIEDRRLTVLTYRSLRSTEPVTYFDVRPYAIAWHKNAMYLIGWSSDHDAIRTFKLDRISAVEVQELQFNPPRDFDVRKFLAGSFGIFQGDGRRQTVRVRFSPQVVRILEECRFHESQRHAPQPDGSLIATFELSSLDEFRSWLLSWGAHAVVLEPKELRAEMGAMIGKMQEVYADNVITRKPR